MGWPALCGASKRATVVTGMMPCSTTWFNQHRDVMLVELARMCSLTWEIMLRKVCSIAPPMLNATRMKTCHGTVCHETLERLEQTGNERGTCHSVLRRA